MRARACVCLGETFAVRGKSLCVGSTTAVPWPPSHSTCHLHNVPVMRFLVTCSLLFPSPLLCLLLHYRSSTANTVTGGWLRWYEAFCRTLRPVPVKVKEPCSPPLLCSILQRHSIAERKKRISDQRIWVSNEWGPHTWFIINSSPNQCQVTVKAALVNGYQSKTQT